MQGTRKGHRGPCRTTLLLWGCYSDVGRDRQLSPARKLLQRPILSPSEPAALVLEWTPSSLGPGHGVGGSGPAPPPRTAVSSALTTQLVYIPSAGRPCSGQRHSRQRSGTNAGSADLCVHTRTHTTPPHSDPSTPTQQYTNDTILDQSFLKSQKSETAGCVQARFVLLILFSLHLT